MAGKLRPAQASTSPGAVRQRRWLRGADGAAWSVSRASGRCHKRSFLTHPEWRSAHRFSGASSCLEIRGRIKVSLPHATRVSGRPRVIVGYARVSTVEQNLELQRDALRRAGCEQIFEDYVSGATTERPGWGQARATLRAGDTLVVWRLDRLGRSLKHLIEVVTALDDRGVGFKSLQESLDTASSGGRLVFHIFGALAQFERELIQERTRAGLAAARARGRHGGRPRKLTPRQAATARRLLEEPDQSANDVAHAFGVSRSTLYRALGRHAEAEEGGSA